MSRDDVEIVRGIFRAWSEGDFDKSLEAIHPDVEWHEPPEHPRQAVHLGHAGVVESITNWVGAWDDWRYEPGEFLDAPGGRVLVCGRQSGRGKGSQAQVSSDLFHLWTIRDGKAVEMRIFMQRDQALRAAGLA